MAKQKLLRMAFTRRDIGLVYTGLSQLREKYADMARTDASERVNSALCMADIDEIQQRIVRGIAGAGGMEALALVAPDRVAEKHAERVASVTPATPAKRKRVRKAVAR